MKKKEDLRKHSNAENIGSLIDKIKPFFLLFLLLPRLINAQISLNNFGITEIIPTHFKYTQFTQLDFNNDNLIDLFLYGNKEKSFVLHKGQTDSTFSDPVRKFFFFPIDDFKWFTKSVKQDDYYLFASRNKRLVGLVSFTKSNSLQLLNTIEFNSYPSAIKIVDLDNNGKNEALVFGNNFNGITIIENDGYFLNSEMIYSQSLFSDLELIDFNNDELLDIVAIDLLSNSLKFFENTENRNFVLSREEEWEDNIHCLNKIDFNNDSFTDIVVGTDSGIEVLEGDSVFSFSNTWIMNNLQATDNFVITPIFNDSISDVAIINKLENTIDFYIGDIKQPNSIKYGIQGIADFQKQLHTQDKIFLALSNNGIINRFTSKSKWGSDFHYSVAGYPKQIYNVRNFLGEHQTVLFSDENSNSVNILKMNDAGKFIQHSEYVFFNKFSSFGYSQHNSILYGFEKKSRLLEIVDTDKTIDEQNYFYTSNPILDIKSGKNSDLFILEQLNDELYLESVNKTENGFASDELIRVDSSYASYMLTDKGSVYYWQRTDSIYSLNQFSNNSTKNILYYNDVDSVVSNIIFVNSSETENEFITIIFTENNKLIYYINNNEYTLIEIKNEIDNNQKTSYYRFYNDLNNRAVLSTYNYQTKNLLLYELDKRKKLLKLINNFNQIEINDYFLADYFANTYLVFVNNMNNLLKFKNLDL